MSDMSFGIVNCDRIVNRLFKVLCVFEQNNGCFIDYLETIIVEFQGYIQDNYFTIRQRQQFYEIVTVLQGLKQYEECNTVNHRTIRRVILKQVNKLARILQVEKRDG